MGDLLHPLLLLEMFLFPLLSQADLFRQKAAGGAAEPELIEACDRIQKSLSGQSCWATVLAPGPLGACCPGPGLTSQALGTDWGCPFSPWRAAVCPAGFAE